MFSSFLQDAMDANPNQDILSKFETSPLYFTRTRGLFRECFPGEKSNAPTDKEISEIFFWNLTFWRMKQNHNF